MSLLNNLYIASLIVVFCCSHSYCQNSDDLALVSASIQSISPQKLKTSQEFKTNLENNGSELQLISTGLFFAYKEFISSQDFSSCAFHPSCSVYGVECVKRHGVIKGGILTFERLMRCNGFSPEKYEKDYKRNLLLDPVK